RFDREVDVEIVEVRARIDVGEHFAAPFRGETALLHVAVEALRDAVDAAPDARLVDVVEEHLMPLGGEDLRDPAAHLARADDQNAHSGHLHQHGVALPAAAADRRDPQTAAAPAQLLHDRPHDARA